MLDSMPLPLARAATSLLLAASIAASSAWANNAAPSRQSIEALRSRIDSLRKELERTQASHSEAADALKKSERAISEAQRQLHHINQQQAASIEALQRQQAERARLEESIREQQQQLSQLFYRQYLSGSPSFLQLLLSQEDPVAAARELRYFGYIARARAAQIGALKDSLNKLVELNEQTANTLEAITKLKLAQEERRQQLAAENQDRKEVLARLAQQIRAQRGEISKLRRDEKRLTELVQKLARITPTTLKHGVAGTPRRNDSLPTPDLSAASFAALKGKLRLPVRGDIIHRFGSLREGSGIPWKGLFIRTEAGAPVKSIAVGTVVFADWLRGFGNLLIIDHGENYMSLYGYNQALLKQVGDQVRAGDDIAIAGNTGGNETPGVYFELRHKSQPFDPLSWSALK